MQLDPFVANLVIGGIAGTVSNLAVFPIDLVKTRLQSSSAGDDGEGALAMIQDVIRADGVAGLWVGSTPVMLGSAPESALQLAVQTWLITSAMAGLSVGSENDAYTNHMRRCCGRLNHPGHKSHGDASNSPNLLLYPQRSRARPLWFVLWI